MGIREARASWGRGSVALGVCKTVGEGGKEAGVPARNQGFR